MKKTTIVVIILLFVVACSPSKKTALSASANNISEAATNSKQDGLSFETAVIIKEKSDFAGTDAEYKWISEHYSNYKVKMQSLNMHNKKPYDIITITLADNSNVELYFDITNSFGKF